MDDEAEPAIALNLAAMLYGAAEDAGAMLAQLSQNLQKKGHRIGGVLQRRGTCGPQALMEAVDIMTGHSTPLCQALGGGSQSCRLDPGGLAESAAYVQQALTAGAELIIIDKFGKQEAGGKGLRGEISRAALSGIPVLTAVSKRMLPAWQEFTGGYGTLLICRHDIVLQWWDEMLRWGRLYRASASL